MLVSSRLDYVPIWDGRIYGQCIVDAALQFTPTALRCAGHASHAYVAVAAVVQQLAPESLAPLFATNLALLFLACFAFHRLSKHVFPSGTPLDHALLTSGFAIHPAFLASVVQPSLDLPLLPGFLWCTVFALERRWTPLVVVGLLMAFTKETGVLLYGVLLASYAISFELRGTGPIRERWRALSGLGRATVPIVAFAAYLLYRASLATEPVIWYTGTTGESLASQFLIPRLDLYQVNYAVLILVLNFAWVASAAIGIDMFIGAVRWGHRLPRRIVPTADARVLGFIVLLTLLTAYALTRFTTFGHPRYFLVATALLLIPFYASLLRLGAGPRTRRSILGAFVAVLLVSSIRTIDPVSRRLYGTFAIGSRDMLRMTRVTGECCGPGQDQLVYSLEFTVFHDLIDDALTTLRPAASETLVVPDSTGWILIGALDARSGHRTLRRTDVVTTSVAEPRHLVASGAPSERALYLALPNGDDSRARRDLAQLYSIGPRRVFRRGGYELAVHTLTVRSAGGPR